MFEYFVYPIMLNVTDLQPLLNDFATSGWRFVGSVGNQIIMEREVEPSITVNEEIGMRSVTYTWDLHKEKPSE